MAMEARETPHPHDQRAASSPPSILVVDDDTELLHLIGDYLRMHDMTIFLAENGVQMDKVLAGSKPDLIVLDLMLPDEDGLSIIKRLKGHHAPPIIMLSAIGEDMDRVAGLDAGADDYLAKPCNPRELLARIHAVLRRQQDHDALHARRLNFGLWTLDIMERKLQRSGQNWVNLTDAEFRILSALLEHPNMVHSRDTLLDLARGEHVEIFDRAIDVSVSRLRRKMGPNDPIRTIRNEGYMIVTTVDETC